MRIARHQQVNGPPGALKSLGVDHVNTRTNEVNIVKTRTNKVDTQIAQTMKAPDALSGRPGKI